VRIDPGMAATEIAATLGGGCFWCLEAVFDRMKGVLSCQESGYMGGHVADPSYEAVCMGTTGHAEVVRITFDPAQVTFRDILHVFFAIHDPTTLNWQGNDVGTQHRSAIFYHSPEQLAAARERIAAFEEPESVVTEVTPAVLF
jgi:peptide-methionine (S)-S-oxide reductase